MACKEDGFVLAQQGDMTLCYLEIKQVPCLQHGCDAMLFARNPDGSGVYGHRVEGQREPCTTRREKYFVIL